MTQYADLVKRLGVVPTRSLGPGEAEIHDEQNEADRLEAKAAIEALEKERSATTTIIEPIRGPLWDETGIDWAIQISWTITEPVCPIGSIFSEDRKMKITGVFGDSIEDVLRRLVEMTQEKYLTKATRQPHHPDQ